MKQGENLFIPLCEASITRHYAVTAAHCVALIRALEIVGNGQPVLEVDSTLHFIDINSSLVGDTLEQDYALIPLPFEPLEFLTISENCQPQYIVDKKSFKGESGRGLLNDLGELCGVLSKSKDDKSIYCGLDFHTL